MQQKDYMDRQGAHELAAAITSYWALRVGDLEEGTVRALAVHERPDYSASNWTQRYDVRSDLVDGTPRGFVWRFDATAPKGKKWRLVKHNRAGTACVSQAMVGEQDAGRAQSAHSQVRRRAQKVGAAR